MRLATLLILGALGLSAQDKFSGPSDANPPVSEGDIRIVRRAREILNSPARWNRADNRECPADQKTYSLYCALEKATDEVSRNFAHRGAAMQQARFVIDEVLAKGNHYDHRLMDYNNDPKTKFADVQKFFQLLEDRIAKRLAGLPVEESRPAQPATAASGTPAAEARVTQADLTVLHRARAILDSPAKWDRADKQECDAKAKTISLFCAFERASKEVNGAFDNSGAAIQEARAIVSELDPQHLKYRARLTDYNNDPSITFANLQKLFQTVEDRLTRRLGGK